ncbi:MAG: LptF/LptG family permease [Bacteroidales bacterium]|nr:LptF/LptG family permease [Bacteroidales bacterium]
MMKKLDWYLIRKFLGTFVYSMMLIILIVIVFDISEKISDFIEKKAPFNAIVFDYYVNFIPFFVNMFSALFTFIAVVFFTSRMAANSEIIAMLSSGISFRRLLVPYLICAVIIGLLNVYLSNVLIPNVNKPRIEFEHKYIMNPYYNSARNIHFQGDTSTFYYVESFDVHSFSGYRFTMEDISPENGLSSKLIAESIRFDTAQNIWKLYNYHSRILDSVGEKIEHGYEKTLDLPIRPEDFSRDNYNVSTMDHRELKAFIKQERMRGSNQIKGYEYDAMVRFSHPFSALILTLIGVAISSRKVRGGTGFHLAMGLFVAFTFILFLQLARVFAALGNFPVWLAAWLPIILFGCVALILLRTAPK